MFYHVHPVSLGRNGIRAASCLSQYFFEERVDGLFRICIVDGLFRICIIGDDDVDHKHRWDGVKLYSARGS